MKSSSGAERCVSRRRRQRRADGAATGCMYLYTKWLDGIGQESRKEYPLCMLHSSAFSFAADQQWEAVCAAVCRLCQVVGHCLYAADSRWATAYTKSGRRVPAQRIRREPWNARRVAGGWQAGPRNRGAAGGTSCYSSVVVMIETSEVQKDQ